MKYKFDQPCLPTQLFKLLNNQMPVHWVFSRVALSGRGLWAFPMRMLRRHRLPPGELHLWFGTLTWQPRDTRVFAI